MSRFQFQSNPKNQSRDARDRLSYLSGKKAAADRRRDELDRFSRSWDPTIRKLLKDLARKKWPERRWLGLFPVSATRIRREAGSQKAAWWVEHDIPPYERYRCAAYFIELEMTEALNSTFTVRSGSGEYSVVSPAAASLETLLARAAQDPPVIIPRRMGAAAD